MSMWAKYAYWGGNTGTTSTTNPYIDYTGFENSNATLRDYSVYDTSGNTKSWKVGSSLYIQSVATTQNCNVNNGKWLTFVVDITGTATTWSTCSINVTKDSNNTTAQMKSDYYLFVKESSQAGGTNQGIQWFTNLPEPQPTSTILTFFSL